MVPLLAPALGLLLTLCTPAQAKNKVRHSTVEAPTWAVASVAVDIGTVTAMKASEGGLILAGQRGIAAVSADGSVQWTTPLPEAMVRNISTSPDGVAFTAWTLAGVTDKAKGLNLWAAGQLLDTFRIEGASVGMLGSDGSLQWQVEAADQHSLAPPALTGDIVAVNSGEHLTVYARASGAVIANTPMPGAGQHGGSLGGVMDHATRGEVVPVGQELFTSFFSHLVKFDHQGNLVDKEFMAGLTPYSNITCGPVLIDELVVFGTTGDQNVKSGYFAMKPDMKNKWKTWSPDEQSGCGDMVLEGDMVYASSNFWVVAFDSKGKIAWESVNKKGGLYPSANRGLRYIGNFATRKTYGDLLAVGGGRVFVATKNGHDVITVLDADSGAYIKTLDVNETLVSMAVVGDTLAVATSEGLRLKSL